MLHEACCENVADLVEAKNCPEKSKFWVFVCQRVTGFPYTKLQAVGSQEICMQEAQRHAQLLGYSTSGYVLNGTAGNRTNSSA